MSPRPQVSFILATHNRRETVRTTLAALQAIRTVAAGIEVIVVDNTSTDGTADMVRRSFPGVRLISLRRNLGSCAKAIGVNRAAGQYVVFLDDDSHPRPGSIARMIEHFQESPRLAQAGFTVHLPDGRRECGALPGIYVGCGVGFRREALRAVGNLDRTLFMQAEEYDLSFRLLRAGYAIAVFDDLHVEHCKTPQARLTGRTVYYDTRNNLIVAARYLPHPWLLPVMQDYTQRYRWIAEAAGRLGAYARGRREGWRRLDAERRRYARWRLTRGNFETLFRFDQIARNMQALAGKDLSQLVWHRRLACVRTGGTPVPHLPTEAGSKSIRRIVLADLGKNIYPFVRGARQAGLHILAIADDRFARPGRSYRDVTILPAGEALATSPDAVVIANTAPVHATASAQRLACITQCPIHCWFGV